MANKRDLQKALKASEKMKELLKAGWTQNHSAIDIDGLVVDIDSQRAVKFCLIGARDKCRPSWYSAYRLINKFLYSKVDNIIDFNDASGRTKRQVLALVSKMIKHFQGELDAK